MEKLHTLEVMAVADRAYTKVLRDFPNFLTGGSITVAVTGCWKPWQRHMRNTLWPSWRDRTIPSKLDTPEER